MRKVKHFLRRLLPTPEQADDAPTADDGAGQAGQAAPSKHRLSSSHNVPSRRPSSVHGALGAHSRQLRGAPRTGSGVHYGPEGRPRSRGRPEQRAASAATGSPEARRRRSSTYCEVTYLKKLDATQAACLHQRFEAATLWPAREEQATRCARPANKCDFSQMVQERCAGVARPAPRPQPRPPPPAALASDKQMAVVVAPVRAAAQRMSSATSVAPRVVLSGDLQSLDRRRLHPWLAYQLNHSMQTQTSIEAAGGLDLLSLESCSDAAPRPPPAPRPPSAVSSQLSAASRTSRASAPPALPVSRGRAAAKSESRLAGRVLHDAKPCSTSWPAVAERGDLPSNKKHSGTNTMPICTAEHSVSTRDDMQAVSVHAAACPGGCRDEGRPALQVAEAALDGVRGLVVSCPPSNEAKFLAVTGRPAGSPVALSLMPCVTLSDVPDDVSATDSLGAPVPDLKLEAIPYPCPCHPLDALIKSKRVSFTAAPPLADAVEQVPAEARDAVEMAAEARDAVEMAAEARDADEQEPEATATTAPQPRSLGGVLPNIRESLMYSAIAALPAAGAFVSSLPFALGRALTVYDASDFTDGAGSLEDEEADGPSADQGDALGEDLAVVRSAAQTDVTGSEHAATLAVDVLEPPCSLDSLEPVVLLEPEIGPKLVLEPPAPDAVDDADAAPQPSPAAEAVPEIKLIPDTDAEPAEEAEPAADCAPEPEAGTGREVEPEPTSAIVQPAAKRSYSPTEFATKRTTADSIHTRICTIASQISTDMRSLATRSSSPAAGARSRPTSRTILRASRRGSLRSKASSPIIEVQARSTATAQCACSLEDLLACPSKTPSRTSVQEPPPPQAAAATTTPSPPPPPPQPWEAEADYDANVSEDDTLASDDDKARRSTRHAPLMTRRPPTRKSRDGRRGAAWRSAKPGREAATPRRAPELRAAARKAVQSDTSATGDKVESIWVSPWTKQTFPSSKSIIHVIAEGSRIHFRYADDAEASDPALAAADKAFAPDACLNRPSSSAEEVVKAAVEDAKQAGEPPPAPVAPAPPPTAQELWQDVLPAMADKADAVATAGRALIGRVLTRGREAARTRAPFGLRSRKQPLHVLPEPNVETFECKVCSDYLAPPVRQCAAGHGLCAACLKDGDACPLCAKAVPAHANAALDQLARTVLFPCKNSGAGCKESYWIEDRLRHEAKCPFRPRPCPCATRSQVMCPWSGLRSLIRGHMRRAHGHHGVVYPYRTFFPLEELNRAAWAGRTYAVEIVFVEHEIFELHKVFDERNACLWGLLRHILARDAAALFSYTIRFQPVNMRPVVSFRNDAVAGAEDLDRAFAQGKRFNLHLDCFTKRPLDVFTVQLKVQPRNKWP